MYEVMQMRKRPTQKAAPVVIGHNVGFRQADSSELFSGIEFTISRNHHGFLADDESTISILGQIFSGELEPSEGSVIRRVSRHKTMLLRTPSEHESISDYLGATRAIEAKRKIESGSINDELFEILAESWDAEDRVRKLLCAGGLGKLKSDERVGSLSDSELMKLQLAQISLDLPELLILDQPRQQLLGSVCDFQGTLIVITNSLDLLASVDELWILDEIGLRHFTGGKCSYEDSAHREEAAANHLLAQAERDLARQIELAGNATARQTAKIEHGRRFADSGIPKTHRGNLKRRSQETLGKLNHRNHMRIEQAEERVRQARELQQNIQMAHHE
jgi:ATPase subunit of ABC transporter with duplicated ATPase domains